MPPVNLRSSLQAGLLVIAGFVFALGVAEVALRLIGPTAQTQRMDSGLIEHHPRFGWQLAKNWQGNHEHDDYSAQYRTTPFRTRATGGFAHGAGQLVLIGDSFTFGLGVDDPATFASQLQNVADHPVSNHELPGTSPDQHLLRLEPMNLGRTEQLVPIYEIRNQRLAVTNVPVPKTPEVAAAAHGSITDYLLEGSDWDRALALLQLLVTVSPPTAGELAPWFDSRFASERELLDAIVSRAELSLRSRSVKLTVAVLPGREVYANPDSVLASFQQHAAGWVSASTREAGVKLVDLVPVDGHLNERGHCRVAIELSSALGYRTPDCLPNGT